MSRTLNNSVVKVAYTLKKKREKMELKKGHASIKAKFGRNYASIIEKGKPTSQIGKVSDYAESLNCKITVLDKDDPIGALKETIQIALNTNPSLAFRLIASLTEEEKSKIKLTAVQNRRKDRSKKIALSV
jgi:hypothetical protein